MEQQQPPGVQEPEGQPQPATFCYCGTVEYPEIGPVTFLIPALDWVDSDEEANVELRPPKEWLEQLKKQEDRDSWWNAEAAGFILTTQPLLADKDGEGPAMKMNRKKFKEIGQVDLSDLQAQDEVPAGQLDGEVPN
uniref:Uncharacterized protein n=1 Tax=Chromera velia CCMP2878 TaxID=1169474 RepID=A0A0G4HAX6_9ALVE|eukprot:Cvel_25664.t1-p1 / transcript=Cvel_25664.t1 / gene=Cvel_25664 / organism=Chromera_velia_CCMP2878 / gene_product=hypothetical protein / transcript_product=hypothetical protein / location=Cvel_scaffold2940:7965-8369(+) / protein_length=135 / sequence_SO=supercontig / SO=protein_coding / is_pseudo=false